MKNLHLLAFAITMLSGVARAEAPPHYYENWRESAPEKLKIKVSSVEQQVLTSSPEHTRIRVQAKANVESVVRSQAGVVTNSTIQIEYEHVDCRCPQMAPVPVLKEGAEYSAFLTAITGKQFVPAAKGKSFSILK